MCKFKNITLKLSGKIGNLISLLIGGVILCWMTAACSAGTPTNGAAASGQTLMAPTVTDFPIITPTQTPTVTVSATPLPPLPSLTPDPGIDDLSNYYGGLVVTLDYVGQTITMKPGQGFLLRLGEEFTWVVQITPNDVLTENHNITAEPGEQGVFIARKDGSVVLTAIGEPGCIKQDPPCSRPSVQFDVFILVD